MDGTSVNTLRTKVESDDNEDSFFTEPEFLNLDDIQKIESLTDEPSETEEFKCGPRQGKQRAPKSSPEQIAALVDYMVSHRGFAEGNVSGPRGKSSLAAMWERLTVQLNSIRGPHKSTSKWQEAWRNLKSHARKKKQEVNTALINTGNTTPVPVITEQEQKVLQLLDPFTADVLDVRCPRCSPTSVSLPTQLSPSPPAPMALTSAPRTSQPILCNNPPPLKLIGSPLEFQIVSPAMKCVTVSEGRKRLLPQGSDMSTNGERHSTAKRKCDTSGGAEHGKEKLQDLQDQNELQQDFKHLREDVQGIARSVKEIAGYIKEGVEEQRVANSYRRESNALQRESNALQNESIMQQRILTSTLVELLELYRRRPT